MDASLKGERKGLARPWPFLGPAFIAAVAYVDLGSFATNIAAGVRYGYVLLWVILASNLTAMLNPPALSPTANPVARTCWR